MPSIPSIALGGGIAIPQLGLGVWQTPQDETARIVHDAIDIGYRHIDTASLYGNEAGVGDGLRASGLPRDQVFVTTKIWNDDQGFDNTLKATEASLRRLKLDHVDLLLVHWPSPHRGLYVDSWRALLRVQQEGRARAIGVSNFEPEHIDRVIEATGVKPVLNQVELHPRFQQRRLREAHAARGIVTQAWSPLGQGTLLTDRAITGIARKHGRTAAQVILRWHLQLGIVAIPKSVRRERLQENLDAAGFTLDAGDMAALAALDDAKGRVGPDPMSSKF
jgi:2,5-diketo-D-gluconate reductase A